MTGAALFPTASIPAGSVGNEPNATVAYLSSLEGSREERAFELAKNEYLAWLEHKADRYTTVYGYMD